MTRTRTKRAETVSKPAQREIRLDTQPEGLMVPERLWAPPGAWWIQPALPTMTQMVAPQIRPARRTLGLTSVLQ